jgi:hypothetical protein
MAVDCGSRRGVTGLNGRGLTGGGGAGVWRLRTWYYNRETEEGVRLLLASKKDSNAGAVHRRTKKVARGGAPAVRTRARPRRGEEARWCSSFGDRGVAGSVSAMPGRRQPAMVWRRALAAVETKWLGGGIEGGGAEVGQPDGAKSNFTAIRVSRRWGYSPYTRYIFGIG